MVRARHDATPQSPASEFVRRGGPTRQVDRDQQPRACGPGSFRSRRAFRIVPCCGLVSAFANTGNAVAYGRGSYGPLPDSMHCSKRRASATTIYSITSSAMAMSEGGTVRPSMRAVEALMTSSNLLDCTTGKSAGLAPLRMRPT